MTGSLPLQMTVCALTMWGLAHGMATAKADPTMHDDAVSVCTALDHDASTNGFRNALLPVIVRNIPPDDVVTMLDYAVTAVCPWHQGDLLNATADLQGERKYAI